MATRLKQLEKEGLLRELLWEERYPDQEPRPGYFKWHREWLETAPLEEVVDLWLRGQNLIGFAGKMIHGIETLREICAPPKARKVRGK